MPRLRYVCTDSDQPVASALALEVEENIVRPVRGYPPGLRSFYVDDDLPVTPTLALEADAWWGGVLPRRAVALAPAILLADAADLVVPEPAFQVEESSDVWWAGVPRPAVAAAREGFVSLVLTADDDLPTPILLAGTADLILTTAGDLTTQILLVGAADLVLVTAGDLTTGIRLVGSADLVLNTAAALTTEILMAGSANLVVVTAADLTTSGGAPPGTYIPTFRPRRRP